MQFDDVISQESLICVMFIHIQQLPSSLSDISFNVKATGNQMKHTCTLKKVFSGFKHCWEHLDDVSTKLCVQTQTETCTRSLFFLDKKCKKTDRRTTDRVSVSKKKRQRRSGSEKRLGDNAVSLIVLQGGSYESHDFM